MCVVVQEKDADQDHAPDHVNTTEKEAGVHVRTRKDVGKGKLL